MKGKETLVYLVGGRALHVVGQDGRWVVRVDDRLLDRWFETSAEAWAAGVAEAARLDSLPPAAVPETYP